MNITVTAEKGQDNTLAAQVTVPAKDVDAAIKAAYKDIANKYNFQGFRRGRAPRPVINGLVGREYVYGQATNELLNDVAPLMLEELDVVPTKDLDFGEDPSLLEDGQDYTVTVTISVRPEAELDSYEGVSIQMPPEEATDAEIDAQINQLLFYRATMEDVEEDRPVEATDIVEVDLESVSNLRQYEGEGRLLDLSNVDENLRDGIVGMSKGETKEVSWTREHEHDDHTHTIEFKANVTVKAIKKSVTPELTEESVKGDFGFDTIAELRDAIKEEVEADKQNSLPSLKEDRVVIELGKHLVLDEVPADYAEQVYQEVGQQVLNNMQRSGISLDQYLQATGIASGDFIADLRAQADERARQSLALDALAAKLEFEATEEEVLAEFVKAGYSEEDAQDAVEEWRSQGRLPGIRESIKRTKAVDWLVENAQVTVVDEAAQSEDTAEDAE